ncbi:hypothetical protein KR059_004426 [Drosophila kikkawai]|nr:hypothetical protein KR059_004426 [Drosophila kikkawai]
MASSQSSQELPPPQPQVSLRNCGLSPHLLKTPSRKIQDPGLWKFAKRINSEIRLGALVCLGCYKPLKELYVNKMANARKHQEEREARQNSISDVSSVGNQTGGDASVPSTYLSDDDDPNSNLSLNAVNGTRLPHIQPIPRRRQFLVPNKKVMDIYLAGTTGG